MNDFINEVSDKVAKIIKADPARIRQAMWDDINENPPTDEDMQMIRDLELNDDDFNKIAESIPDELLGKILSQHVAQDGDCGLW